MAVNFSSGALQRRLSKKAQGMGAPGPRGGSRQLAPQDGRHAGSMIKGSKPEGGRGRVSKTFAKGLKK